MVSIAVVGGFLLFIWYAAFTPAGLKKIKKYEQKWENDIGRYLTRHLHVGNRFGIEVDRKYEGQFKNSKVSLAMNV